MVIFLELNALNEKRNILLVNSRNTSNRLQSYTVISVMKTMRKSQLSQLLYFSARIFQKISENFRTTAKRIPNADCNIIIGSSLLVSPFNILPTLVPDDAAVVTINMERIKHIPRLTSDNNSLFLKGKCDEVIDGLLADLGWKEEFEKFVADVKAQQQA